MTLSIRYPFCVFNEHNEQTSRKIRAPAMRGCESGRLAEARGAWAFLVGVGGYGCGEWGWGCMVLWVEIVIRK